MATQYPRFTSDMVGTYKLLVPQMSPIHFAILAPVIRDQGYDLDVMEYDGPEVISEGLKYVHNDMCYPALLVIGQFIVALKSGDYDPDKTALLITQTGGGCRASNYIHLLRKALVRAGFPQVPVVSLNTSGLEKDNGFKLTYKLLRKALGAVYYGDMLMALSNCIKPYENTKGQTMALVEKWQKRLVSEFRTKKLYSMKNMRKTFSQIAEDFSAIEITRTEKIKVGIVGEIYVKYSPLGNNHLEDFLASEDCEVCVPGLMGFLQYCVSDGIFTAQLYGGETVKKILYGLALRYTYRIDRMMNKAIVSRGMPAPGMFEHTIEKSEGLIGHGCKMGEGWLLTAEMAELIENGFPNIICAQPFGCLPNHVAGKGMIAKLRERFPETNITPIDYDPGATAVNQENRIKLMLAVAKERMDGKKEPIKISVSHDMTIPQMDVRVTDFALK